MVASRMPPAGNRDWQHCDQHYRRNQLKNLTKHHRCGDRLHYTPGDDDRENVNKYRQNRNSWSTLSVQDNPVRDHGAGVKMMPPPAL
jgi:hypothetical protein